MEIAAAGYALVDNILEADYALGCYIKNDENGAGRVLACVLLDARNEREIASTELAYNMMEDTYETLPYFIWSLFANAPLQQRRTETLVSRETPVRVERVRAAERPGSPEETAAAEEWKRRLVFLNARAGLSSRFYLAGSATAPSASIFTFDVGLEPEIHFFDFLALQLGLNFSLDRAEYQRSPLNPVPIVYTTSVLSIPLMAKYIFSLSPQATLGPSLGAYAIFPLLGVASPPPFGLLAGLDASVKTGLGVLLFDLRYSVDLGVTGVSDGSVAYRRMFLTLSAGYKFGFVRR
jgi:hypothetical protein